MESVTTLFFFLFIVFLQAAAAGILALGAMFLVYKRKYGAWGNFPRGAYFKQSIVLFLVLLALYFLYQAYTS